MKKFFFLFLVFQIHFLFAQSITFNKIEKVHNNTDKFLYKIDLSTPNAEYLAELEVRGFSKDDEAIFHHIYKKAKEIGANAFAFQPFESIDGKSKPFDPHHYKLNLYYVVKENFPSNNNEVYLIASSPKKQTINFNKEKITLEPRTFVKRKLQQEEIYTISTRKLLGSSVKISADEQQKVRYFQISAFKVRSNSYGNEGGINLKSGDIILLERSYAEFLTLIYTQIQ